MSILQTFINELTLTRIRQGRQKWFGSVQDAVFLLGESYTKCCRMCRIAAAEYVVEVVFAVTKIRVV